MTDRTGTRLLPSAPVRTAKEVPHGCPVNRKGWVVAEIHRVWSMTPKITSRSTRLSVAFLSATALLMSNRADAAALTIIGASSILSLLFLPLVSDSFDELTQVADPADRSWSSVRDAPPPRFREGGECQGRVTLMCYDDAFADSPGRSEAQLMLHHSNVINAISLQLASHVAGPERPQKGDQRVIRA